MKVIRLIRLKKFFWVGLFLSIISSILGVIVPLYIKNIIDLKNIFKSTLSLSFLSKLVTILVLQTIISAVGNFLISREGERQIADIRNLLQTHLIHLPIPFFDNQESGQLSSRVINDSVLVKNFITGVVPEFITSLITTIGTFIVLFLLDWKLSLLIFLIFPLDALITIPLGNYEEKLTVKSQKSLSDLTGIVTESLRNIRAVKLSEAEENVLVKFGKKLRLLYKLSVKNEAVYAVISPIQSLVSFVLIVSVLLYGGYRVQQSTLTIGSLTSFLIYFYQVIGPINTIADFYTNYKQTKGAVAKIIEILHEKPEKYIVGSSKLKISKPYSLSVRNLCFSYDKKMVLEKVNVDFPAKKKIAIVGSSGAGKTTLVNLITRLYNPNAGSIMLNGIDSKKIDLSQWRSMFGVVSQENYIISGTIYDNLVFGLKNLPSNDEINNAIKIANLSTFLSSLRRGVHEIVGEQGLKLSGGQRQRLQIARAYLKDPDFLILDEATSNLDADSEKKVSLALKEVMKGKTIIAIAHRLSTIIDSDKIYFLDNKTIAASGTHEQLLRSVPKYRNFVKEQFLKTNISGKESKNVG